MLVVDADHVDAAKTKLLHVHLHRPHIAAPRSLGERARIALGEAGALDDRLKRAIAQD
jgi:hypothetical protein